MKTRDYMRMIEAFVSGVVSADAFEKQYIFTLKNETETRPEAEAIVLMRLFTDADAYCGDPELRNEADLDAEGFKQAAQVALGELNEIVPR